LTRKTWLILATLVLAGLFILAAACGDDDDDGGDGGATASLEATAEPTGEPTGEPTSAGDAEAIAELENVATQVLQTDSTDEAAIDFFLGHITAEALGYFGYDSPEDCAANAEDCIGGPSEVQSLANTTINGDQGETTATSTEGDVINLLFLRENDLWKLNGFAFSADIPEGVTVVGVSGVDYGFEWDPAGLGDGNVAFAFKNDGAEIHELQVASVSEDFDIEAVKAYAQDEAAQEGDPPGTTGFYGFVFATPGLTSNAVLEEPLAPGDYVLLCFLPSPDGTPHVVLDMYSEFTVE
jgi:hypothetical protein